jgi:CubicO group peptidase (beta-lactamase class C family)
MRKRRLPVTLTLLGLALAAALTATWTATGTASGAAAGAFAEPPPSRQRVAAEERFLAARQELLDRVASGELPSISVAVFEKGKVLWEESLGWADREAGRAATPESLYGMGSLGKSILATAVMVLVEAGKIDLDAPVTRYLGEATFAANPLSPRPPTVREVLQMAGGIPHGHVVFFGGDHAPLSSEEVVDRYVVGALPPGRAYVYSNFSYGLLEQVVRGASGEDYAEFARRNVFAPLGMAHTRAGLPPADADVDWAVRYGRSGNPIARTVAAPRSSLDTHSSLHDLLLYGLFHLGFRQPEQREILKPASLELMHNDRSDLPGAILALGWGSVELETVHMLITNGLVSGASSALVLFPEQQVLVVVLANISSDGVTDDIAFSLADILVPSLLEEFEAKKAVWESEQDQGWEPTPELLGAWKGEITTPDDKLPLAVVFQPDGDVHVQLGEQPETLLDRIIWSGDRLSGGLLGAVPWKETGEEYLDLEMALVPSGERILGWCTANLYDGERFLRLPARLELSRDSPRRDPRE